jgi:hypothetical protein
VKGPQPSRFGSRLCKNRNGSQALPDIPTVGDFAPGYEASTSFGIGAPKGTPVEIIDNKSTWSLPTL